ncbi:MAG TPA: ABC transporter permease [Kineosporiaceae bacterium]
MLRLTVKSVRGHLVRFVLTALAVTLGVAFVAGSFVLRDSINATLDNLLNSATKGLDVKVRGLPTKLAGQDGPRPQVPLALATRLAAVPGVARSEPDLRGTALIVGKDGLVVRNGGAPGLGFAYSPDSASFTLVKGSAPTGPGEVLVEQSTLARSGLAIGDSTQALIGGTARQVRITGEVTFGALFGATAVLVDRATAEQAFAPGGTVESISLSAASGVSQEQLRARVAPLLPASAEAVTGKKAADEATTGFQKGLGAFTTFLLVFAGITLFVGAFIIANTFSMLIAQRTRELALLRAVGASRGQVFRMVVGEAVLVGLLGSAIGIGFGLALTAGLKVLSKATTGVEIAGGLPVRPFTIVVSLLVGTLVTVVSAALPARRAARIAPVVAMRDDMIPAASSVRRRGVVGVVLMVIGALMLAAGVLPKHAQWASIGFGAGILLIGTLVAAPLAARPLARVIGWPFVRFGGVVGRLATDNTMRVPRRTANTAAALMIGLTLVTGISVIAASIKASVADVVAKQLTADFVLTTAGSDGVPATLAPAISSLPGVDSVATLSRVDLAVGNVRTRATAATAKGLADTMNINVVGGSLQSLGGSRVLVNQTTATDHGWQVGSQLTAQVGVVAGPQRLEVGGIIKDSPLLGPLIVDRTLYQKAVPASRQQDLVALVRLKPAADAGAVRADLVSAVKPFLVVSVQNGDEFVNAQADQVNQLIGLLYALLGLAIVIAVLGIINTLALSVIERTREIGLLRAIGLRRNQLARMITVEAALTAVFGALLGTGLGLALGVAMQHALGGDGTFDVLSISWGTIIVVLLSAALAGVCAAVLPAIRGVRMNVLQAIAAP